MPENKYISLLPPSLLAQDAKGEPHDLLDYNNLEIQLRMLSPDTGTNPLTLSLEHAADDDPSSFVSLGVSIVMDGEEEKEHIYSVSSFLRYVRWRTNYQATSAGDAVASIHIIAKK